ncbi:MAG: hypothetical protein ACE5EB_00280 [Thermodesulfobacteriota bacterium]
MYKTLNHFSAPSLRYGRSKRIVIHCALFSALALMTAGCETRTLPEADSPPAVLYAAKCGLCHPPRHPQVHTYTGWKKVVSVMEERAEDKGIKPLLSKQEKTVILDYLKKNARKGF